MAEKREIREQDARPGDCSDPIPGLAPCYVILRISQGQVYATKNHSLEINRAPWYEELDRLVGTLNLLEPV